MNEIIIAIGMPIIRSIGGWANNALKDGKISNFEFKKLVETILRTGIISTMIYYGAEGYGVDINLIASTSTAIIVDMISSNIKKKEK